MAFAVLGLACASVVGVSLRSCVRAARGLGRWTHLGSLFLSIGSLVAFLLPGLQLIAGGRRSKLSAIGWPLFSLDRDVIGADILIALVLIGFFAGELLIANVYANTQSRRGPSIKSLGLDWNSEATWTALLCLSGFVVFLRLLNFGSLQATFSARGTAKGVGFFAILGWAPALTVAIAALHHHYDSRKAVAASILLVAYLIVAGNRSPLLLIFVAFVLRFVSTLRTPSRTFRVTILLAALAYLAATLAVAQSAWRGEVMRGNHMSLVTATSNALADPFASLGESGLDSLDGLILARQVDPRTVKASWTDPVKIVTGFVPHQLWPAKPEWLSGTVARTYLHYGASGMFLSGAGYTTLIWGGAGGAILAFFLLGIWSSWMLLKTRGAFTVRDLLVIYFLLRFTFAGDAFDGFHVLGLACVVMLASLISYVMQWFVDDVVRR